MTRNQTSNIPEISKQDKAVIAVISSIPFVFVILWVLPNVGFIDALAATTILYLMLAILWVLFLSLFEKNLEKKQEHKIVMVILSIPIVFIIGWASPGTGFFDALLGTFLLYIIIGIGWSILRSAGGYIHIGHEAADRRDKKIRKVQENQQ